MESMFDNFGGYYSVIMNGIEVARFAPSYFWSEYALQMQFIDGFDYKWVDK